ncbi:DUF3576 domain-containing protein [Emcibacter sp.]|uniref:DUF3576 domain-containing protein n=1 Tax=Emcibacter sp. TaxID=1979954 RepID=UPI002AA66C7C|nr:DUF3576 domain-containing protein [Emcibacter sp.]
MGAGRKLTGISLLAAVLLTLGGCSIFGGGDEGASEARLEAAEEVYQIGVNAYLWRASLDTIAFMPVLQANQSSGAILTDWRTNPRDASERTKTEIYIVGRKLQADALRVVIHREQKQGDDWVEVGPRPGAEFKLTNAILLQARTLRRNNAPLKN